MDPWEGDLPAVNVNPPPAGRRPRGALDTDLVGPGGGERDQRIPGAAGCADERTALDTWVAGLLGGVL